MLRDVFYYGSKPNVHSREKFATSLEDARKQCTTEHNADYLTKQDIDLRKQAGVNSLNIAPQLG